MHELVTRGVQNLALGRMFSGAIDWQGDLWMWGQDNQGQLGLGKPSAAEQGARQADPREHNGAIDCCSPKNGDRTDVLLPTLVDALQGGGAC